MLIECIPNISEGRRPEVVAEIVAAIRAVPGIQWLDQSSDADHHRSVLTFAGAPEALEQAISVLYTQAAQHIDLRHHQGEHPRMGAVDVVPFVPLTGATMADCVALAKRVGERIAGDHGVPVVLYEEAASAPHRRNLAEVRKGEFEGLKDKLARAEWKPDYGPTNPHEQLGASAVGAREALVAYNVYLDTRDVKIAQEIAKAIRGSSGGLGSVKAMGLYIEDRQQAQVSMNLVNFRKNPLYRVVELIRIEAARWGVRVTSSEIVGLVPQAALLESAAYYLQLEGYQPAMVLENKLQEAQASTAPAPTPA
ncbi:MAG: glutamate formimidoyltransferase [Candidatus Sericytochromatia bacterium]|nr:glutamate formimidoyltransferase [Candidatus Sericytochromatia bacterium]